MSTRHQELADFLKALRQRCDPAQFGIAGGSRRRTQGLRREEVAQLAGISPTWYTWIEQAREVSMSPAVLDRLANALRMDKNQRGYLFELAGKIDPQPHALGNPLAAELLQQVVGQIASPAYMLGDYWDILAYNAAALDLFSSWATYEQAINLLEYVFCDPAARDLVTDWETRSRRLVAEFRADSRNKLETAAFQQQLSKLRRNPEFDACWHQHDVLEREGGMRSFRHPTRGELFFQQFSFALEQYPHIKLVMLIPVQGQSGPA